jgi:hypothetical protein
LAFSHGLSAPSKMNLPSRIPRKPSRRPYITPTPPANKNVTILSRLSVADLTALFDAVVNFENSRKKYQSDRKQSKSMYDEARLGLVQEIAKLSQDRDVFTIRHQTILKSMAPSRIGLIRRAIGATGLSFGNACYESSCTKSIAELQQIGSQIASIDESRRALQLEISRLFLTPTEKPSSETILRIGAAQETISILEFRSQEVGGWLKWRRAERNSKNGAITAHELEELRARAAITSHEKRRGTRKHRSTFAEQLKIDQNCPYCGNSLMFDEAHIDHIYPIAKGGQTVSRNLIFVCARCNLKKSDHTVREFARRNELDYEKICLCLEKLGKFI